MSPPIRLLISDVDGTMVRPDHSLSPKVADAVKRLRDAGVPLCLISARPVTGVRDVARQLGLDTPLGAFNGGIVAKADGEVVHAARLSPDAARRAMQLIDQPWVTPWVFADDLWHARDPSSTHVSSERSSAAQEPVIVDDFTALLDRVEKIVAVSDEEPRLAALEKSAAEAMGKDASVARSQRYYLDFTAPDANKANGVTALARMMGVPLDAVATIGDGTNDIRMFEVSGFSVAMGNGSDTVKAAAHEVTASNADDGVAEAIDRYILPRIGK